MSTVKPPLTDSTMLQASTTGEVCIANISTAERRKRLNFGIIAFAVAIVLLVILMVTGANRWFRLPLLLVFAAGTTGYFQWHDKTCVGLARINSRQFGDKPEKIEDASELAQIQRQSRRVKLKSIAVAIPLTLIALALPVLV